MYPHDEDAYNGIFVYEQIKAIEKEYPNVHFDIYFINGRKSKLEYLKSIYNIHSKVKKNKYDLIHIHFGLSGLFLLCPLKIKIPILVTFHGSDIQKESTHNYWMVKISKMVAKRVNAAITLNKNMDKLVRSFNNNTYIIPCAVDTETFKPIYEPKQYDGEKIVKIIFPSNRNRQVKNYDLFKKTIEILELEYNLKIMEYELKNMSRNEIAQLYSECDALLLTSKSEGSPQVIKEAMSCNLPCVCTPVGDVSHLLSNVKDCYVSNQHNAKELADLVYKSIQLNGKGISGREKIFELKLDTESISQKIFNVYSTLINK